MSATQGNIFTRQRTRQAVANELLDRLQHGPQFSHFDFEIERGLQLGSEAVVQAAKAAYRRWAQSWVLTELCNLVPELKQHLDSFGYYRELLGSTVVHDERER